MASLLGVVGSVQTPAWPTAITADNVESVVGAEVYLTTSQAQSDAWQVAIGASLWDAVLTRAWPIAPMASAISDAASSGHLRVWSAHPSEETALGTLGVAAAFEAPTQTPVVLLNGFANNRAGYFAVESTHTANDGDTTVLAVRIKNRAPSGPPSILLGQRPQDVGGNPLGTIGTDVNVYLPSGARVGSVEVNDKRVVPFAWNELGAHVVSWSAFVEPHATMVLKVSYSP